jgi:PAS domain S-box-containing protein
MTANAIDAHELARSLSQLMAGSESQPSIEVYANLLQFLMGVNSDLLLLVDTQGRIHYCNRNVRDALGLDAEDVVGQPLHVLVHQPDHHLADNLLAAFAQSGITPPSIELRLNCKSEADQFLWVQMSASSMLNENAGQSVPPIICLSAKDISAQKRAEAEIEHQLAHDNLTGLVNRAQFIVEVD